MLIEMSAEIILPARKKFSWFVDKCDKPWEIFLPAVQNYNEKRRQLLTAALLLLDESMSGWCPKTSKLGGLPNYTYEPRKPVPLGTMFRNGVEAVTGIIMHQDIVQLPELQARKKYHGEPSHMPDNSGIPAHTAEVLHQVEGAGITEGGWVGGNAWFGSVTSAVEVKRRLKVDSMWIIKNNSTFFPKQALLSVMSARHGMHPAGTWVVFTSTIADVKLIMMAYAWSQKGVSFFLSTCGSTTKSDKTYRSHFENEYGQVDFKELPRPKLAEFIYEVSHLTLSKNEGVICFDSYLSHPILSYTSDCPIDCCVQYLPLIDEHNRQRQDRLALEKCWPTKSCWFRLICMLVGMLLVDLHHLYQNKDTSYLEWDILKFADHVSVWLKPRSDRPSDGVVESVNKLK